MCTDLLLSEDMTPSDHACTLRTPHIWLYTAQVALDNSPHASMDCSVIDRTTYYLATCILAVVGFLFHASNCSLYTTCRVQL